MQSADLIRAQSEMSRIPGKVIGLADQVGPRNRC